MKIKVYIHAEYGDHYDSETKLCFKGFQYKVWPCRSDSWGVFVCEQEVEIPDVDENELRNGTVKLMKDQQQKLRAECEVKVNDIEQTIQEMLCLPAEVSA